MADRGLREPGATQLLGDVGDLPGRDALHHPLHHRQDQSLFRSLVALEEIGDETSVPGLRNPKSQCSHPRRQSLFPEPRSGSPSVLPSVHDDRLPDAPSSGLPAPGSERIPLVFESVSSLGQKIWQPIRIQGKVKFGYRFPLLRIGCLSNAHSRKDRWHF